MRLKNSRVLIVQIVPHLSIYLTSCSIYLTSCSIYLNSCSMYLTGRGLIDTLSGILCFTKRNSSSQVPGLVTQARKMHQLSKNKAGQSGSQRVKKCIRRACHYPMLPLTSASNSQT